LINLIEEALSWPRIIDIYHYAPGSGGEFFTSLCAIGHLPTRNILKFKNLEGRKVEVEWKNQKIERIFFDSAKYFDYDNIDISELGKHMFFYPLLCDPKERILYYKMVLAHSILNYNTISEKIRRKIYNPSTNKELFNNINIILCTHWVDLHAASNITKNNTINNRTFGVPLFEKQKYGNLINLDPQTKKGKDFVINCCIKSKLANNVEKIKLSLNHSAFDNIKLKFPFMDYLINNDFNSIKDYINNRYGPELDHDFIDKALINYKKVRIDRYL
jgi:hypothetical protein